ncbi:MAG: hypothetical protein E6G84_10915 [Alphaproteobacteria bacterium]|nr:MAG: hypothetical protein E6G84_10915 [Alphaproteobacteria bacterium]
MTTNASEGGPVRPAFKAAMPARPLPRGETQADRRSDAIESQASVYYGTIEYRRLLLNVFSTPAGWRVAVTKTAYPFRELHATLDRTMDAAIETAKRWADETELRHPTYR